MNATNFFFATLISTAFLLTGCGAKNNVDTAPLEKSFASADGESKTAADKVVSAVKSADYSGAVVQLKTLASKAKLTSEQQNAIKDTIAQIEKQITAAAAKVGAEGQKAASDLQKSLTKP